MRRAFITGTAGFIGFHLARLLLDRGWQVHGLDGMTAYYDLNLKRARLALLAQNPAFTQTEAFLEDADAVMQAAKAAQPDAIIHLAAQAGVRYSLEAPRAYIDSNLTGTFNVMEAAVATRPAHLLMASTSSAYGANEEMPFKETDKADHPLTIYAATKKANEAMGHAYAHLHDLPTKMFRFFTVYGPWGRPDMAPFKFTKAILAGEPIDIYNNGEMWRDFTYVTDLVQGIAGLIDAAPVRPATRADIPAGDSLSPAAPFRVVNIGNGQKVRLMDFVNAIEGATGRKAICNFMPMQQGDVPATWADASLLNRLTGTLPATDVRTGIQAFVDWYRGFYQV
jgi:UDP-glucuronate 4-epimerase